MTTTLSGKFVLSTVNILSIVLLIISVNCTTKEVVTPKPDKQYESPILEEYHKLFWNSRTEGAFHFTSIGNFSKDSDQTDQYMYGDIYSKNDEIPGGIVTVGNHVLKPFVNTNDHGTWYMYMLGSTPPKWTHVPHAAHDFFGTDIPFTLSIPVSVKNNDTTRKVFHIKLYAPKEIEYLNPTRCNTDSSTFVLQDSSSIKWNPDPNNKKGVFIILRYHSSNQDSANFKLNYPNDIEKVYKVEDTADGFVVPSFEFRDFPNNSLVSLEIARINTIEISYNDKVYRVTALTHRYGRMRVKNYKVPSQNPRTNSPRGN